MIKKPESIVPNNKKEENIEPELSETFEIEFLNTKLRKVEEAMSNIGNFSFRRSGVEEEGNLVYFEGERRDGTKIKIIVEKGKDYKSPKEIADSNVENMGYKQKIIEAVKSKNADQLISVLKELNLKLTGLETGHFGQGAGESLLRKNIEKFFQDIEKSDYGHAMLIISLGGGSQLVINVMNIMRGDIRVHLTDNSTERVKKAWERFQ